MTSRSTSSAFTRRHAAVLAPLSRKEERIAIQSARKYVAEQPTYKPGDRVRVLGAELRIEKPEQPSKPPLRFTRVVIVDYAQKQNLSVLVDRKGNVARVEQMRGQPAFHEDEIEEARTIAERDDRLAAIRKRRGLFVSSFGPPASLAKGARVIGLLYVVVSHKPPRYELLASVAVDLGDGKVESVDVLPLEGR